MSEKLPQPARELTPQELSVLKAAMDREKQREAIAFERAAAVRLKQLRNEMMERRYKKKNT